jgi:putative transposase
VSEHQAFYPVATQCRVLEVSTSGYYAWRKRKPSPRRHYDDRLQERIVALHRASRSTYGSPRLRADLAEEGLHVGRKRVARLMRRAGICGITRRRFTVTTRRNASQPVALDLVKRAFVAEGPDMLWVADITYVPTWSGFLYLAVVLDLWSRRVVGWAMRTHLRTELVLEALEMAIARRRPQGVIHHSDHGCQYTAVAFGARCRSEGVRPSMGSVGDCYDNALCESFFATLECELLDRSAFRNPNEARLAVFDFIEGFYNSHRRHSALGLISPSRFEELHEKQTPVESSLNLGLPEADASGLVAQPVS